MISEAANNPNLLPQAFYWYIAPTFGQAKDIAWKVLNDLCDGWGLKGDRNESDLVRYVNGIPIKLMGADNMARLKGVALYGVVADEYGSWKNGRILQEAIMPTLQDTGGWMLVIGTPAGYNFFYDLYEYANSGKDDDFISYHFTSYDNPNLKSEELDKTRGRTDEITFDQEYMAEFKKVTGAIWKDFSRDFHVIEKYIPDGSNPIYASLDFGFALGHATSFGLHEVTSDQVKTFDGFNEYQKDPNEIIQMIINHSKGFNLHTIYCDSARPDLIEMLQKAGFNAVMAIKDVELGISKVSEYMKINPMTSKPQWVICSHLKDMIRQIENYQWDEVRTDDGKYKKTPKKDDDDACDMLRYFLFSFFKIDPLMEQEARNAVNRGLNEDFWG
jgi:phage terminase large subunit